MHFGDTNQTTSTQTHLSPNALPLAPTATTKTTLISPANKPPNLHTQNHAASNKSSCTQSPTSLHHTIKEKIKNYSEATVFEIRAKKRMKSHQEIS
jgi:hypothetical protein